MSKFPLNTSKIDEGWKVNLSTFFESDSYQSVLSGLETSSQSHTIFPPAEDVFRALELTPLENVKAVILGQDPYHGPGQAHGLSFSVPTGIKLPPSLRNIFKELHEDIPESAQSGTNETVSGDLTHWAEQGVLLLNATLTVNQANAGSHRKLGWSKLTDLIIQTAGDASRAPTVFILWGKDAISKKKWIDPAKHLIHESVHPSPLSAYRGFFGSKPFSKTNEFLTAHNRQPIQW